MAGGYTTGLEITNANDLGSILSTAVGAGMNSGGSANVAGNWVTLTGISGLQGVSNAGAGGLPFNTAWVCLSFVSGNNSVALSSAFDLGIGPVGSERIIIPNIVSPAPHANWPVQVSFPLCIPAGVRIAARARCQTPNDGPFQFNMQAFDTAFASMEGAGGVDALGINGSVTIGTSVVAGTVGVKGSWTQLGIAAHAYLGFFMIFDTQNKTNANSARYLLDIGVGPPGSEQTILPNLNVMKNNGGLETNPSSSPFLPIPIAIGQRVSARCCSQFGNEFLGVTLYGVWQ